MRLFCLAEVEKEVDDSRLSAGSTPRGWDNEFFREGESKCLITESTPWSTPYTALIHFFSKVLKVVSLGFWYPKLRNITGMNYNLHYPGFQLSLILCPPLLHVLYCPHFQLELVVSVTYMVAWPKLSSPRSLSPDL